MSLFLNVLPEERETATSAQPSLELLTRIFPTLSRVQYAVLFSAIVAVGLVMQVFVHLQLSQGAFVESGLRQEIRASNEQVHALQSQLMSLTSTQSLRKEGKRYNMSDVTNPVGITLKDGEVHGLPQAAPSATRQAVSGTGVDTSSGAWRTDDGAVLVSKG